jgi:hypothetical protein
MDNTREPASTGLRIGLFALLALVMLATRINHFGALPDASWAVFFMAGFYLRGSWRIAFPLLMALAVGIDYVVITGQGIPFWSHYCVSTAYLFLLPSYAAPFIGGAWLRGHYRQPGLRELGLLAASSVIAASACFLVSNGSFYWISANVPVRSFGGWMQNMGDWYLSYLATTLLYVGIGAALHALTLLAARMLPGGAGVPARH